MDGRKEVRMADSWEKTARKWALGSSTFPQKEKKVFSARKLNLTPSCMKKKEAGGDR